MGIVLLSATIAAAGGCRVRTICVRTQISPAANQNHPVAVDILLVRNKDLIKKLLATPASDWFENRAQFGRDYPDAKDLIVIHREWVPGQVVPCSTIPLSPMPRATIVFANYFSKGDHRAHLKNGQSAAIHLTDEDLEIVPIQDCSRTTCPKDTP